MEIKRNPNTDYSLIDFCIKTTVLPQLPNSLFKLVQMIDINKGRKPPRYNLLKKKLDNYVIKATILN